ncbi:hypothetical protein [Thermodesulfovibrio sp.]|uniref:hypothetical protein n=1 Tax=Thermodesulfovibrio sp. TaxID=2067987 RepID=UPI0030B24E6E
MKTIVFDIETFSNAPTGEIYYKDLTYLRARKSEKSEEEVLGESSFNPYLANIIAAAVTYLDTEEITSDETSPINHSNF